MLDYTSSNHISIWFCLIHIQSFVSVNFFFIPRPCASKFLKFMDFVFAKEELLVPRSGCHYIHNLERGWRNLPKTKKSICSEHTQSGGDHSPSQCAHLFAGWVGAGGLGWLLLRVTVGWSVLILFLSHTCKGKEDLRAEVPRQRWSRAGCPPQCQHGKPEATRKGTQESQ